MSLTFSLNGTTSSIESTYFPPITLDGEWEIGVLNFQVYHSIPNLKNGSIIVNKKKFVIPEGSYELKDIATLIEKEFNEQVIIRYNPNTLKATIVCKFITVFNKELSELLGFSYPLVIEENGFRVGDKPIDITSINMIRINCNIAKGSYINGRPSHTIHEFYPNVPVGYKINEVPFSVIYHSINTNHIDTLKVDILDQLDRHINFRGETLTIRLHLRKKT